MAKRSRRGRTCRFEELEGREMLSVTPWSLANDFAAMTPEPATVSPFAEYQYQPEEAGNTVPGSLLSPLAAADTNIDADADPSDLAWLEGFLSSHPEASLSGTGSVTWENGRITRLDLSYLGLTGTLDVSGLTALTYLDCYYNQLTGLNASGCTALTSLECGYNQLADLNVSGCTALQVLYCYNNQLATLDVSGCTALNTLYCSDNQLTTLDVSGNTVLRGLYCHNNQLTELDLTDTPFAEFATATRTEYTLLD